MRSPYTEHAASGLPNPTHLEEKVRFIQAQDQQVIIRSCRIVAECLLSRSMLIKIYVHDMYSRFLAGAILSFRKYDYDFITTVTMEFDASFQSQLSSSELLMLNTLVLLTYLDIRTKLSIFDSRLLSDRRTILTGRGPNPAMVTSD